MYTPFDFTLCPDSHLRCGFTLRTMEVTMQVNGIIAEYNPFHNGHKYQMEEARRRTSASYTVIAMSGNFVQRGAPALVDKHSRAEMALRCGADLVLELPTLYACSSAEYFASGAVALLDRLGVVTHLCFGSECGDVTVLSRIAEILADEPAEYSSALKRFMQQGYSYPNARVNALMQLYPFLEGHWQVFSSPNNILAIEYIKILHRRNCAIQPVTTKRTGAGYHDRQTDTEICSALALRQALYAGSVPEQLDGHMPPEAALILTDRLSKNRLLRSNDLSLMLHYKLLLERDHGYQDYLDVSPDLSARIRNRLDEYVDFDSFCDLLKTKEMTYNRISRCLLHILLDITKADMEMGRAMDYVPYARILGFRKGSEPLLSAIKEKSSIPLVSKLANAEDILDPAAYAMLRQDVLAGEVYQSAVSAGTARPSANEYSTPLAIL